MLQLVLMLGIGITLPSFLWADLYAEVKELTEKKEIVIAMHQEDHPPFHMVNEKGELIGHDVDVAKAIAKPLKVKVRFDRSPKTYDEVVDFVASGKADIGISKLSHSPRRALKVVYKSPYMSLNKAALINRLEIAKNPDMSLSELLFSNKHQLKIGTLKGSIYERYVANTFPGVPIQASTNWEGLVDQVKNGTVAAIFNDNSVVEKVLLQDPKLSLTVMPVQIKEKDNLFVIVNPRYPDLASWIDGVIQENDSLNVPYNEISKKYKKYMKVNP